MAGLVLDGGPPAREIEARVAARVAALRRHAGRAPVLAVLLVGAGPTATRHGQLKERACRRVGIEPLVIALPEQTTTAEVLARIERLNGDERVDGIFLQHPLPGHVDERQCFDRIAAGKDVGGDSSLSLGRLATAAAGAVGAAAAAGATTATGSTAVTGPAGAAGEAKAGGIATAAIEGLDTGAEPGFVAATPAAILALLSYYGLGVAGKRAVIVGRSPMVGKPLALLLLGAHATVTVCHSRTRDLAGVIRRGEVVVGAVGKPELIKGKWIRDGAVVIDAGYHPLPEPARPGSGGVVSAGRTAVLAADRDASAAAGRDGRASDGCDGRASTGHAASAGATGDVELRAVAERCAAYTPVPGGVGPMTIAMLLVNTVTAAERAAALRTGPPPGRPR
jgi:methylenetetrahydrofolate dehydrogenase (NADP+)/methenyltetrahydrofolate cyclohydrolase